MYLAKELVFAIVQLIPNYISQLIEPLFEFPTGAHSKKLILKDVLKNNST